MPCPQELTEQFPNAEQLDHTYTGPAWQVCDIDADPEHDPHVPPVQFLASVTTPVPHVTEHADDEVQFDQEFGIP